MLTQIYNDLQTCNKSVAGRLPLTKLLGLDRLIVDKPILGTKDKLAHALGWRESVMIRDRRKYEDLDWECPFCGFPVRLVLLDSTELIFEGHGDPGHGMMGIETTGDAAGPRQTWKYAYLVCQCPRNVCRRRIFVKVAYIKTDDGGIGPRTIVEAYPAANVSPNNFPDFIPRKIREDFAEASRCRNTKAFKGCVVMCRRVIQDIAKDKKIAGKTNKEQIKRMHVSGLITKAMFDSAHEIRHYGGFGAHPQDDGLDDITSAIAESLLVLTGQFLENIYVMTERNKELAKRRQQAKQAPSKNDTPPLKDDDIPF